MLSLRIVLLFLPSRHKLKKTLLGPRYYFGHMTGWHYWFRKVSNVETVISYDHILSIQQSWCLVRRCLNYLGYLRIRRRSPFHVTEQWHIITFFSLLLWAQKGTNAYSKKLLANRVYSTYRCVGLVFRFRYIQITQTLSGNWEKVDVGPDLGSNLWQQSSRLRGNINSRSVCSIFQENTSALLINYLVVQYLSSFEVMGSDLKSK